MRRHQLPSPQTSFVGRRDAVAEVAALVARHRLVTLVGPGGCGKTRLALAVVAQLDERFGDGIAFVDLAATTAAVVPTAFATATGVHETGTAPLPRRLADALADRHVLVLVDNCDRVTGACAELLDALLTDCAGLVVLATSRSPLGGRHEVAWSVPPLGLPAEHGSDVEQSEAGRLLVDRARLAQPGFRLLPDDRRAAAEVCRRLDGMPLAIELAAARLRALDVGQLAKGLEDRFRLLSTGPRSAPRRQRTLEASIEWSHDLLDPDERTLFRRLGVFAATFTAEDADLVTSDAGRIDALVHASLLAVEGSRFRMLESVREYARVRLAEAGEEAGVQHRHLDHVLAITAWFNVEADGPDLDAAIDRLEPMVDDLREALRWAMRSGRITDGLRLAADLRLFWVVRGRNHEGQSWLMDLIAADPQTDVRARVRAGLAAGELCFYARDPERQERLAAEALNDARRLQDPLFEAWALVLQGWAQVNRTPGPARALLSEGREWAGAAGDLQLVEFASYGIGTVDATTGDFSAAHDALATGVAIARTSRQLDVQYGLGLLGYVDVLQARLPSALAILQEATGSLAGAFDRVHRDMTATWLAVALQCSGQHASARPLLEDAIASARAAGTRSTFAVVHLGLLDGALGDHETVLATVAPLLPAIEALGVWYLVQAMVCVADAAAALGDRATASQLWREAKRRADDSANPLARTVATAGMARSAALDGDPERARAQLRAALRIASSIGFRTGAIDTLEALAIHLDDADLRAAVTRERADSGYVRLVPLGGGPSPAPGQEMSFDEAVAAALRAEPRPARALSGWDSLTAAEMRVATLVADGLTNPEIAERLLVSRRTVQTHLSHVYDKLGLSGRVELAAALTRAAPPGS